MDLKQIQPICIAGKWCQGGGDLYATRYPATGEVVTQLHAASLADVEEAIDGAQRAFRESGWAQRKPHERAAVLYRIAELIRAQGEELAQLQRLDNGKPITETRNLVASAASTFQFFAARGDTETYAGRTRQSLDDGVKNEARQNDTTIERIEALRAQASGLQRTSSR